MKMLCDFCDREAIAVVGDWDHILVCGVHLHRCSEDDAADWENEGGR